MDAFMDRYNTQPTNQGKHCQGRTPMETLEAGRADYDRLVPKPEASAA
ncbi:MAG: hypothetical protein JNK54_07735 [Elusimicrobia bacterium]|nr:hypothetical protein [Elusimicrobiota bacterium]